MSTLLHPIPGGVHTHIGQYHILQGVDLTVPRGEHHRPARPQRRRQDHHAAHHHGPLARLARRAPVRGRDITQRRTPDIACAGIAYVPENMGIFSDLTVRENLFLARAREKGGEMDEARLEWIFGFFPAAEEILEPGRRHALRRPEADARHRPRHRRAEKADLLVDEPTKGLAPAIIQSLIAAFRELKAMETILLVEQNFSFVCASATPWR
jgi:branched-chain amino acid transport system ATP-binding protein